VTRAWFLAVALAACSSPASPDARGAIDAAPVAAIEPPPDAVPPPDAMPMPPTPRRWIAGDLHMHVAPPGATSDVTMTIPQIARVARKERLEFVIVVPHLWTRGWNSPKQRAKWQALWGKMAALARAQEGITMIPGVEYGESGVGHFGISGVDLATLEGPSLLEAAHAAGAFIVINHPFAVPTNLPNVRVSRADLSYKPWTSRRPVERDDHLDGVEVWNHLLRWAGLISVKNEVRGFVAADRLVHAERRPIALVGGSDNHRDWIKPTTWVLATDASEAAILEGLHAGATCVGGTEAALEARGDADPADRWAVIGEVARGGRVELRWRGRGRLFIDGVDRGPHDGQFVDEAATGVHTYRLEVGKSRCGFVYANLDG